MLKNIKILREEKGISQQTLGDAIGMSQQSINKYENHNIEPDISTLKKISDYFRVSIDYIVDHTDIRNKAEITKECDLNKTEYKIIRNFRILSHENQNSLLNIIDEFTKACKT